MMLPALPLSRDIADRLAGSPLSVLLDVDGTLAPIAERPEQAHVPEETLRAVESLVALPGTHVSIVTGRSVADGRRMVPIDHVGAIGNHGFEVLGEDGEIVSEPAALRYVEIIRGAGRRLEPLAREVDGMILEDKQWTLSIHYRLAARAEVPRVQAAVESLATELGLEVTHGKEILEMRPPIAVNKGTAAVLWVSRLGSLSSSSVVYIGDDRTDEDAFRELRAAFPRAVTVRVGDPANGATSAAEFRVESPEEVCDFLVALAASRRASGPG